MRVAVGALTVATLLSAVLLLVPWPDPGRRVACQGIVVGKETTFQTDITYGGETVHVLMLDVGRDTEEGPSVRQAPSPPSGSSTSASGRRGVAVAGRP